MIHDSSSHGTGCCQQHMSDTCDAQLEVQKPLRGLNSECLQAHDSVWWWLGQCSTPAWPTAYSHADDATEIGNQPDLILAELLTYSRTASAVLLPVSPSGRVVCWQISWPRPNTQVKPRLGSTSTGNSTYQARRLLQPWSTGLPWGQR